MNVAELFLSAESKTLEFKRDLSSLKPILKTVVAFANTAGGTIVLGVSQDREVVGIPDVLRAEEALANAIADGIKPAILPEIEISTYSGKNIILIKVAFWKGPFYLKKEGVPDGVYIRLGSTSRPAGEEIIAELKRFSSNLSFDQQSLTQCTFKDLDSVEINRSLGAKGKKIKQEKLLSLGILTAYQHHTVPTVGGILLFGKELRQREILPDAIVRCARFKGEDKYELIDQLEVSGPILNAIEEVPKFVARNTHLSSKIESVFRQDFPEYSPIVLREILINALAHSDYSIRGSHIQVAVYSNRIEVQNPGMFPFGFTLEDLKSGISRVRNRVIARVFHHLKLMEEWGSGYRRVVSVCQELGIREPEWVEIGTSIRVLIYPSTAKKQWSSREEPIVFSPKEEAILAVFNSGKAIPFREIYQNISIVISERMLRYAMQDLKKKGILDSSGRGPATVWYRK